MNLEPGGEPIRSKRLILYILPVLAVIFAALSFLPFGLVKIIGLALVALPAAVFLFDKPKWIFYILILIIFSNLDVYAEFRLFRLVLGFFFASFAVAVLSGRRIVLHDNVFTALVIAFLIFVFQSLIVTRDLDGALYDLSEFSKSLLYIGIAVQFVRNRMEFRHFLLVTAFAILLSNFFPFVMSPPEAISASTKSLIWEQGVLRYEGFVLDPNLFAITQNFLVPILLFLIAVYSRPRIARPFFLVTLLASVFVLILTFSRGGFLSLALLLVLLFFIGGRNRVVLISGLVLIAVVLVIAPEPYWERIGSLFKGTAEVAGDFSVSSRMQSMRAALVLGLKNPILGIGLHGYLYHVYYFMPIRLVVHNAFLQIFSETGLISFTVFIGIVSYNFFLIRRLMKRKNDPEALHLGRFLMLQHIVVLFNSMFIPVAYERVFWFMLALPSLAGYAYMRSGRVTGMPERSDPGHLSGRK